MYIGINVKYLLLLRDFNENCIFWTDFKKSSNVKFHEIHLVGAELFHADKMTYGHTERTKLILAFRNFANAPTIRPLYNHHKLCNIKSTVCS